MSQDIWSGLGAEGMRLILRKLEFEGQARPAPFNWQFYSRHHNARINVDSLSLVHKNAEQDTARTTTTTKQRWWMLKERCGIPVAEITWELKNLLVSWCSKDLWKHQRCIVSGDLPLTRLNMCPLGLWKWQRPWRKAESTKGKVIKKLASVLEL